MFDIGFWELSLVGVVALLVIGPERLPAVARHVGFWLNRARSLVASVNQEIKEELYPEEIRRSLLDRTQSSEIHELVDNVNDVANSISSAKQELSESLKSASKVGQDKLSDEH